jgi:predicted PurR-regulated permease PerM
MSQKKVVGRSIAIALGIVCVILIAGLIGAIAYYTTVINDKNSGYSSYASDHSHTDSDYNSLANSKSQLETWLAGNITSLQGQITQLNTRYLTIATLILSGTIMHLITTAT